MRQFTKATIIGGLIVLLPIAIFIFLVDWLAGFISGILDPLSDVFTDELGLAGWIADLIIIAIVILILFILGMIVKTTSGAFVHRFVETRILKAAPGYSTIRESIVQILGNERPAFSQVALARIFGNETMVTAFITDTHTDGRYSVFVPTGPNPMSGNIYHLKSEYVHIINIPVEEAMRSIISCGAGSINLINAYKDTSVASSE
jgi:uncharacterized membrane protein